MPRRPLRRHPALQDLSREHHELLIVCRAIRWLRDGHERAQPAKEVWGQFRWTWSTIGVGHLHAEEATLLPFLTVWADVSDCASSALRKEMARIRSEHEKLRHMVALAEEGELQNLYDVGQILHDHIRFEERTFFQTIQELLPADRMGELGERLQAATGER